MWRTDGQRTCKFCGMCKRSYCRVQFRNVEYLSRWTDISIIIEDLVGGLNSLPNVQRKHHSALNTQLSQQPLGERPPEEDNPHAILEMLR
jgi:hypothetical protein